MHPRRSSRAAQSSNLHEHYRRSVALSRTKFLVAPLFRKPPSAGPDEPVHDRIFRKGGRQNPVWQVEVSTGCA
jgi:hypothetical protein